MDATRTTAVTTPADAEELLALEDAAEVLCVSKSTLYRMLDRGEVKGIKVGRQWRFRHADLEAYLSRGPVATALAAMPMEVLDKEIDALSGKLTETGETVPAVQNASLDPWEARVLQVLLCLVKLARVRQASDIHLEVMREDEEEFGFIRFRIDGVLHEAHRLPLRVHEALILRARIMGGGDPASESYLDASLHLLIDEEMVDLRISVMSTFLGEAMTLRLLESVRLASLDEMGFHSDDLASLRGWLQRPGGFIFTSGPSGCGKTTLMYKMLQEIANPTLKVVTVEDPIEYQLPWVMQVEINPKTRNFASALRAFLRHDVDVLMVGEMRDLETMDLALHTATTGHLVMTSVHTQSAADTMRRVVEVFPVEQQEQVTLIMANGVIGVISVRLARVLCPHCKQPAEVPEAMRAHLDGLAKRGGYELPTGAVFYRAVGCVECGNTGYRGRTGIYEVLEITPAYREAFSHGASREELTELCAGMRTLAGEAIRKAAEGITSLDEIMTILRQHKPEDELYDKALEFVRATNCASISMLQRKFKLSYTRASRLMSAFEERGYITPAEGSKPREVIATDR